MATTAPPRPAPPAAARDGFGRLLRAEWTKIRSIRSTAIILVTTVVATVLISMLAVGGRHTQRAGPIVTYADRFHFVYQPLTGDGTILAQVRSQDDSQEQAKAGLMIKASTLPGAPYAAILVTPHHGVRWQANFALPDAAGSASTAPRWLRLTRTGGTLTGWESADGVTWSQVGTTSLTLPRTVQVGMFVASPPNYREIRHGNSSVGGPDETVGRAVFDNVGVRPVASAPPRAWSDLDVGGLPSTNQTPPGFTPAVPGTLTQAAGVFTVTGSGDVGGLPPDGPGIDDAIKASLAGVEVGMIAIVVFGVLFATSEYKTGIIRTTFAASPRRVRVFAAKAVVLGVTTLAAGLVASVGAFLVSQPVLHRNGYRPPEYPNLSLTDGLVFRAVVGTALFLAAIALLSFGVGAILRRTASAITLVVALVIVPQLIAPNLGLDAEKWINRVTPVAGLAIQETRRRFDTAIAPWAGFAVLCGYVAAVLAVAFWLLRRRDA